MRLLIVSNRLPATAVEKEGEICFQQSIGGLVSGLRSWLATLKKKGGSFSECLWIGWPGISVADKKKKALQSKLLEDLQAFPVFLSEREMDKFYHGFCNKTIWPLFHYFPPFASYEKETWAQYQNVNRIFCDAVTEVLQPDDIIWVQDYHLMLLPKLLRDRGVANPIGFFLHIPFPSFEIFRLLPTQWRSDILEGMLGADLVGFHTHDYTRYFLTCVHRILGLDHNMGKIITRGRLVKADAYPMGIDYDLFARAAEDAAVRNEIDTLKKNLGGLKVILSADRLDYTKGVLNRLKGYEIFLEKHPEWKGRVVLILVVVASRIGVEQYQQMKRQIDEAVGRINGKWGNVGWMPVVYQYQQLAFEPLTALYNASDVCLVTPLRDGMNLIAKEYLASRGDNGGVLVLSEMAGAAKELGEAVIINPSNREDIADALLEALAIPLEEQKRRNRVMQRRLRRCNVAHWAEHFLNDTESMKAEQKRMGARLLSPSAMEKMIRDFRRSEKRLIFLDYDGTLVPFSKDPRAAVPPESLLDTLRRLCIPPENHVVLISGRDKTTLQGWFGNLPMHLVAEHGIWIRERKKNWTLVKPLLNDWKERLIPLLEVYCDRVPGSLVEEKEFSVTWHYRGADPELSSLLAKELVDDLTAYTANIDVNIFQGNRVVEIRSGGVNKGTAGIHLYSQFSPDFSLVIGDDTTDEDLFRALPESVYTVRVGMVDSHAKYNLRDHTEVIPILNQL